MKAATQTQIRSLSQEKEELAVCLASLDKSFTRLGLTAVEPTSYSIDKFMQLPENQRRNIAKMINIYDKVLSENVIGGPSDKDIERLHLQRAVNEFKLKVVDQNVFSAIEDGDVVEIYDAEGKQIYRNLMFCKLSSYSLLDVAVNTWQELYERPVSSLEGIYGRVVEQLTTKVMTTPYNIEKHILKERFIYSRRQKIFMMDMKYISPLENEEGARVAVISVARVEVLSDTGLEIDFI